jgi:hypothetical protein
MLHRHPDWQARLGAFLAANAERPFGYGEFDCCLFVANAVLEMTGVDLAAPFRGQYGSRAGARDRMAEFCGGASVERVASRIADDHGLQRVGPLEAARGDMVLIQRRRECSLGLMNLNGQDVVIPFARGLRRIEWKHAIAAWRI